MINEISAILKFNALYTCKACGKIKVGQTIRKECSASSTDELKAIIDSTQQTSVSMPYGWSYNGEFNCGCLRKS